MALVVTSDSAWRLMHEGGNHAERREELKKLKLDLGDSKRDVESFLAVLSILIPGAALLSSLRAGMVASEATVPACKVSWDNDRDGGEWHTKYMAVTAFTGSPLLQELTFSS